MGVDGVKTLRGSESAASCLTVTRGGVTVRIAHAA